MPWLPIGEGIWHSLASSAVDISIWLNGPVYPISEEAIHPDGVVLTDSEWIIGQPENGSN